MPNDIDTGDIWRQPLLNNVFEHLRTHTDVGGTGHFGDNHIGANHPQRLGNPTPIVQLDARRAKHVKPKQTVTQNDGVAWGMVFGAYPCNRFAFLIWGKRSVLFLDKRTQQVEISCLKRDRLWHDPSKEYRRSRHLGLVGQKALLSNGRTGKQGGERATPQRRRGGYMGRERSKKVRNAKRHRGGRLCRHK